MSNIGELEQLAQGGVSAIPVNAWPEVADRVWQEGVAAGDSRYCVISVMLRTAAEWWSQLGGVPSPLAEDVDRLLRERLPAVLEAADPAEGARRAEELQMAVAERLEPSHRWDERGYVRALRDA